MTTEFSTELASFSSPSPAPQGEGRGLDFKRLIRMRLRLMVLVFVCALMPLVALAWFLWPLEYEAGAVLRFMQKQQQVLSDGVPGSRHDYEQWVLTQVELIQGPTILTRALDESKVRDLPMLAAEKDKLVALRKRVRAQLNPRTELVMVTCRAKQRQAALDVVKVIVEKYMEVAAGLEKSRDVTIEDTLLKEEERLSKELNTLRDRINLRKKGSGVAMLADGERLSAETQTYHERLAAARADDFDARARIEQYGQFITEIEAHLAAFDQSPDTPIYAHQVEALVAQDPTVLALEESCALRQNELEELRKGYQEGAPRLRVALRNVEAASQGLADAKRRARGNQLNALLEQYQQSLRESQVVTDGAAARIAEFERNIAEAQTRAMELSEAMADIELDEKRAEELGVHLREVRDRIRLRRVESNAPANVELASAAQVPESPDYSRKAQVLLAAFGLAGLLGLGAGVFRELTDQQVRTPEDVSYLSDLTTLAVIPHASLDRLPKNACGELVTAEYPESTSADEYRRAITRIIYPPEGSAELSTCLVTSASRGDGKTSVACNIAIALAQANRRVLLVDISSRRPDIENLFGVAPGPGLSEVLDGSSRADDTVRPTRFPNLFVIGPGNQTGDLAGRLASRDTIEFFERAEEAFEHVVIDSPPALLMADAKLLAPVVDGVVMVIGAEVSSAGMVRRCVRELRQVGANLVGVVLNGIRQMPGGYLQANLDAYYEYSGAERGQPSPAGGPSIEAWPEPKQDAPEPTIVLVDDEPNEFDDPEEPQEPERPAKPSETIRADEHEPDTGGTTLRKVSLPEPSDRLVRERTEEVEQPPDSEWDEVWDDDSDEDE